MEIKKDVSYVKNVKCSDVYTESQTDYILPDYMGDVRKILFTDTVLRPSGRFAGGDEVEFSGVVVYNVIYLDSEGELSSAEFASDYDYTVKCSGESYNDSIANTRVSNYAIRVLGPRKISARASLVGRVNLSENSSVSVSGNVFEGNGSPEVNTGSLSMRSSKLSSVVEREYAELLTRLDGAIADEVSVLYPYVEVMTEELRTDSDGLCVKGKLRMCAIIKNGSEQAFLAEKMVGFEEKLDFDGASSMEGLIPEVSVSSVKATVNADENGCEVVISGIAELCVRGEKNTTVDVILDGYMKEYPTDTTYEELSYERLVDTVSVKGTHNAEISRTDIDSENLKDVLFLTSTPKVERVEKSEGSLTVFGEVRYSGVASEVCGEKLSYVGVKFSSPFEVNVNINCQNVENCHFETEVHTMNCSANVDSEKLYATCTLEVLAVVSEKEHCQRLSSINRREGEKYQSAGSLVTVYYPTHEDTLFSVAKRFRTSSLKVAADNNISDAVFAQDNPTGSLSGIKKLVIY